MSNKKIIIGSIFFAGVFFAFAYLFLNQSYLINQYKFKKLQEHTFSEDVLTVVSSNEIVSFDSDAVDFETKMRIY